MCVFSYICLFVHICVFFVCLCVCMYYVQLSLYDVLFVFDCLIRPNLKSACLFAHIFNVCLCVFVCVCVCVCACVCLTLVIFMSVRMFFVRLSVCLYECTMSVCVSVSKYVQHMYTCTQLKNKAHYRPCGCSSELTGI